MNDMKKMTLEQFERQLDIFGGDLNRWPNDMRQAAESLLESQAAARDGLKEYQALEKVLDAVPATKASNALKAQIVAVAMSGDTDEDKVVPFAQRHQPQNVPSGVRQVGMLQAAALAASFALGIYLGVGGLGEQAYQGALQLSGISIGSGNGDSGSWLDVSGNGDSGGLL